MQKKQKKILVVDDEPGIIKALEIKLKLSGFNVTAVYNGIEALEALQKETFDLIVLDLMMPKMDGFTLLSKLKDKKSKTPIIVASNLGQQEDIARAKELGAKDYFVKSHTSLAQIVEHIKINLT